MEKMPQGRLLDADIQTPEPLKSEAETAALKDYFSAIRNLDFDRANELSTRSAISEADMAAAKKTALVERAFEGWIQDDPEERTAALGLSPEIAESKEFEDALIRGLIINLAAGHGESALRLIKRFNLPGETFTRPDVLDGAKRGLRELLLQGYNRAAVKLSNDFQIPANIIASPEVQDAAKECILRKIGIDRDLDEAKEVARQFALSEAVLSSTEVWDVLEKHLGRRWHSKWWENKNI